MKTKNSDIKKLTCIAIAAMLMTVIIVSAQPPGPQNDVIVDVTPDSQTGMPGDTLTYDVNLTNNGTVPDKIDVDSITGVPTGWTVELKDAGAPLTFPYSTPLLQSKESYFLTLDVHIPTTATTGATMTINVKSHVNHSAIDTDTFECLVTLNNPPVLSAGAVNPATGDTTATFTYSVTYTDADNDAPSSINVFIDGTPHAMTVRSGQDGDYTNGEIYEYATTGAVLGIGTHTYQFNASEGVDYATGDTGIHSGPTVTIINNPPALSAGAVNPATGDTTATFTYSVTYTDADNDAPSVINVVIDGTPHSMTVKPGEDGDYTNGEIYEYATTGAVLGIGPHTYQFNASDGVDYATGDTGIHSGPTVMSVNIPPMLSAGAVNPTAGNATTTFTYSVTYTDADNDPPSSINVIIDGTQHAMTVKAGEDGDYTNGEIYEYTTTGTLLGGGTHTYQFTASDGIDPATGDTGIHSGPALPAAPATEIPALSPIGLIALVCVLSVIVVISVHVRKKR